jgi:hypothetical protein
MTKRPRKSDTSFIKPIWLFDQKEPLDVSGRKLLHTLSSSVSTPKKDKVLPPAPPLPSSHVSSPKVSVYYYGQNQIIKAPIYGARVIVTNTATSSSDDCRLCTMMSHPYTALLSPDEKKGLTHIQQGALAQSRKDTMMSFLKINNRDSSLSQSDKQKKKETRILLACTHVVCLSCLETLFLAHSRKCPCCLAVIKLVY